MHQSVLILLFLICMYAGTDGSPIPLEKKSSIQIIHNSPDTSLQLIDIYLNETLILKGVSFREATSYFSIESDTTLKLIVTRSPSTSVQDSLLTFAFNIESGKNAVLLLQGVTDTLHYSANPSGKSLSLSISLLYNTQTQWHNKNEIPLRIASGCTDITETNLVAKEVAPLLNAMNFGSESPTDIIMPPVRYDFILLSPDNQTIIREFAVDLSQFGGQPMVVFFSGFNSPSENSNGKQLGVFGALANGTIIDFQLITSITEHSDPSQRYHCNISGELLSIDCTEGEKRRKFEITDYLGRAVYSQVSDLQRIEIPLLNNATGIYFIFITEKDENSPVINLLLNRY